MGSSYMIVSFKYKDHQKAEDLLNVILSRADKIIREDQQRDVVARISYIKSELPTVTQTETRDAMIGILSDQEGLKTMLVADKRFAFTMVDPPHASPTPTFPPRPSVALLISAFTALVFTSIAVYLGKFWSLAARLIAPFKRSRARAIRQPGRRRRLSNVLSS